MADHTIGTNERSSPRLTLVAGVETIVSFTNDVQTVTVTSMDGLAPIWWTVDKGTATVDGTRCMVIPASICAADEEPPTSGPTEVHLISTGTPTVIVSRG